MLQGPAQAYPEVYPYIRYDISSFLQEGENVLALHVYYNGCITRSWQSGDLRQGAWFRVTDENGTALLESNKSCKAFHCTAWQQAKTIGYDTQFIEKIRGELIPENWKTTGFDDSEWENAAENTEDDHKLVLQAIRPVDVYLQKPKKLEMRVGVIFGDMGEEVTGSLVFNAKAESKATVMVRCGEELNDDGSVRYDMRCYCYYQNEWTLSGREEDRIEFYDYMTFRYFEISAPKGSIKLDTIGTEVRHYPMNDEDCIFETDDAELNQIFEICRRGVKLGTQETFVDCPQP